MTSDGFAPQVLKAVGDGLGVGLLQGKALEPDLLWLQVDPAHVRPATRILTEEMGGRFRSEERRVG